MAKDDDIDRERSNIDELRRRMKDVMTTEMYEDDNVFQRFLRARNQNLDAAETMLKKHVKWRKTNQIDTLRSTYKPPEILVTHDVMTRIAYDKEGRPVIYAAFGNMDIRGGYQCVNLTDFFKFLICHLEEYIENMKEKSQELGKPITQWVMIFDYQNLTFANATYTPAIHFFLQLMSMYEANYPERVKAGYVINGSWAFQICFAMFKPFLANATMQKIKFHTTGYQNDLLEIIDADQLPAFLGGNRTDPDGNPRCEQTIRFGGGPFDESFYQTGKNRKRSHIPDARILVVNRFSKARVEINVMQTGDTLEWKFKVKNKNIDFCVLYQGQDQLEEMIPKQRIETVGAPENGMLICEKAGIYILEFDNTYSWINNKTIYYKVTVEKLNN